MTNEEAIRILKNLQIEFNENYVDYSGVNEAFNLAFEALRKKNERPQGEWKHMTVGNTNIEFIICSNCSCGCPSYSYIKEGETEEKVQPCETTFCPNCGAYMQR